MKKIISITTSVIIICTITSCKKDIVEETVKEKMHPIVAKLGGITPDEGTITYSVYGEQTPTGTPNFYYNGAAQFFTTNLLDPSECEDVGTIYFGNIPLNTNTTYWGTNIYQFEAAHKGNPVNTTQFGANVQFRITGGWSSYDTASVGFYVPEKIYLTPLALTCGGPRISQGGLPHIINWNADPNNKDVAIILVYNGPESKKNNPLLSDQTFSETIVANDIGTYSVTAADLSSFPIGSVIEIYVARSGEDVINSNGKTIDVVGYAYTKRTYTYIP
jgi:hypothetical protein